MMAFEALISFMRSLVALVFLFFGGLLDFVLLVLIALGRLFQRGRRGLARDEPRLATDPLDPFFDPLRLVVRPLIGRLGLESCRFGLQHERFVHGGARLERGDGRKRREDGRRQGNPAKKRAALVLGLVMNGLVNVFELNLWAFRHRAPPHVKRRDRA